jgi:hypothetical protein
MKNRVSRILSIGIALAAAPAVHAQAIATIVNLYPPNPCFIPPDPCLLALLSLIL